MTRPVEPDVCGQIKKVGFSRCVAEGFNGSRISIFNCYCG